MSLKLYVGKFITLNTYIRKISNQYFNHELKLGGKSNSTQSKQKIGGNKNKRVN